MTPILRSLLVLTALFLLVTSATGSVLSIQNCDLPVGSTASVDVVLDEAPDGLSGYSINVSIGNPDVATVSAVSFPSWASLYESSLLPSADCKVWAIDLHEQVQAGATDITLATLTIRGLSAGATAVTLKVSMMNDDTEGNITPILAPGTFSVTAPDGPVDAAAPEEASPDPSPVPTGVITAAATRPATPAATASATAISTTLPQEETVVRTMAGEPTVTETAAAGPESESPSHVPLPISAPLLTGGLAAAVISALVVLYMAVTGRL